MHQKIGENPTSIGRVRTLKVEALGSIVKETRSPPWTLMQHQEMNEEERDMHIMDCANVNGCETL